MNTVTIHRSEWMRFKEQEAEIERLRAQGSAERASICRLCEQVEELQLALTDMIALCRHKASNSEEEIRVESAVSVLRGSVEQKAKAE